MFDIKGQEREEMRGPALDDLRYMTLAQIEERLLVIEYEKPRRIHNAQENPSGDEWDQIMEADEIAHLDVEKAQLQLKRQFIIDRRESWLPKTIWNLIVPIIAAIITAYITAALVT